MNFKDVFKSSFLQEFSSTLGFTNVLFYMTMAAVFGFYIFLIYRVMTRKSFYNKNFNLALWTLTVVIAAIIIAISSNIVLSLGMVGALSIVRYRTAIKDPLDLVFLFWAIAEGIICGAGMGFLAALLAAMITIGLFILNWIPLVKPAKLLTISATDRDCEEALNTILNKHCKGHVVKSRIVSGNGLELVIEFLASDESACVNELAAVPGVRSVCALTQDGEVSL